MKIAWPETIKKMRGIGYSKEETEYIKRDPTDAIRLFIDQGRKITLFFKYKGVILKLLGIVVKGKTGFKQAKYKELEESFLKNGWLKKI